MKMGAGKTVANRPRKSKAGIAVAAEDNPVFFGNLFEEIKDVTPTAVYEGGLMAYAKANPEWYFETFLTKLLPAIISKGALGARNAAGSAVSVNIVNYSGAKEQKKERHDTVEMKQNANGTLEVMVVPDNKA